MVRCMQRDCVVSQVGSVWVELHRGGSATNRAMSYTQGCINSQGFHSFAKDTRNK